MHVQILIKILIDIMAYFLVLIRMNLLENLLDVILYKK